MAFSAKRAEATQPIILDLTGWLAVAQCIMIEPLAPMGRGGGGRAGYVGGWLLTEKLSCLKLFLAVKCKLYYFHTDYCRRG